MTLTSRTRFLQLAASAIAVLCVSTLATPAAAQVQNYVIGSQDVLTITVFDEPDLTGKYAVELDGTFSFPLIGHVKAAGLTLRDVEAELRTRLTGGYFQNPQLSVAIEQYRSQRVFVVGEVKNAGTYALTGGMTLIEALAKAGSITDAAGSEVLVIRGRDASAPAIPPQGEDANVTHVSLKELQGGRGAARSLSLSDGDTIYVPRADVVYVFGQVKNPGSYALRADTTVLQVLSLAGGVLPAGATNRLQIIRAGDPSKKQVKVKLTESVNAGDTIVVPERFF